MQTFDAEIKQVTFYFIRVTYGSGDLWYHISFDKDDKRLNFRMTNKDNNTWKMFDTNDPEILSLENDLGNRILHFEKTLVVTKGRGEIIKAALVKLP